ncbi:site-specific integrase [Kitasatospora sp. GP82]|uniref:tyrosine-type recombinase/integrase n=1 Tax=Kitasatospora sp. GP82 TaxID=3035089 RepID=UPI002474D40D|nr:site-specific integrase [Kitasatospora sp. GP82]
MRAIVDHGRVYRRCGCHDHDRHQLGAHCPLLTADPDHGTWTFAVDLPAPTVGRHTVRRGGFPTEDAAHTALRRMIEGHTGGFTADPNQTVAEYLTAWLQAKELVLKPTTLARYRTYVTTDLIPALGAVRLDDLGYPHIAGFVHTQLAHGRGRVTIHRILATLSSALGDAVRCHRLLRNPARPTIIPRPAAAERHIWTVAEAAWFLRYCRVVDPAFADLIEVIIGTGMRKGEALGLHWNDVHLMDHKLYVRWTLTAVNNGKIHLGGPKTEASRAWVSLSPRAMAALHRQAALQMAAHPDGRLEGLVFTRPDGEPLRPQWVLDQLRKRTAELDLPKIGLHDLRHTAASIMIAAGIPLAIVSKTLRHSHLAITADLYGHLLKNSADEAVLALAKALDHADALHADSTTPVIPNACLAA